MQSLQLHLTGAAQSWLNTLPNDSIGSWGELESQFVRNFRSTYKRPTSLEEVKSCVQQKGETLRSYIQRWSVIKNSGPSAEDMLYGPCRIHYAYLDGKRVSNHQMMDCRTFLRLQNAMDLSQGARQGGKSINQGYQMQRLAKQLESKVYIYISNDPTSTKVEERKVEHIKIGQPSNNITTSYHGVSKVVRSASQVQESRPSEESTQTRSLSNGAQSSDKRI
jgi:hypothetical protein